ncbi:MAG: PP2C family protein-serine/threonine phosphatase [Planctomycetota bacterium]|nr:PP2C family protein-serine/threonine phosphatase [Planctomycetota bacterium]
MGGKTITLLGSTPAALTAAAISQTLSHWSPETDRPAVVSYTFEQVRNDEALLDTCGVAWIHVEGEGAGLYSILGVLQDRHLPAMISRPNETQPLGSALQEGMVIASAETPPATLCSILRTLWCQSGVLRGLQREMRVMRAHQGGLCDQIDKIDEELRLAAQLQREFLPSTLPQVGPVEFRVLYRPAGYVSGDIYDVVRLDEEHIGFFVADAVGHGVPAALMTMYIKRALRTKEIDLTDASRYRIIPPDEALAQLNKDMVEHQGNGKVRFATACYGVINCRTLEMTFARAGHPFPILLHADGTSSTLSPDGGMLGVFPEEVYELTKTKLKRGDRLLLYSDGFEMAFPEGTGQAEGQVGLANEKYTEEFRALAHGTLDEALSKLVDRLDVQTGSLNQQDDMTVVCLGISALTALEETDSVAEAVA